jgi:hypothetical protein
VENDRDLRVAGSYQSRGRRAAHVRKVEVHHDNAGLVARGDGGGCGATSGDPAHAHIRLGIEDAGDHRSEQRVILDHEDADGIAFFMIARGSLPPPFSHC